MVNPYQAPKSNIENGIEEEPRSKKGWKIYFWIILVLHPLTTAAMFFDTDDLYTNIDKLIALVIYPIIILAIYGFAYNRRIFSAVFWKIWIFVALISDAYSLSDIFRAEELEFTTDGAFYLYIAVILVLVVPLMVFQYICLYNYGFKSLEIWADKTTHRP